MPVMKCKRDGKGGFKYGSGGHCYIFTAGNPRSKAQAFGRARKQGVAIKARAKKNGSS